MCDCSTYQCIDLYLLACAETVTLPSIVADETGTWKAVLDFAGVQFRTDIPVISGVPVTIPNNFNENYRHTLKLYRADGTLVNDTCYKIKTMPTVFTNPPETSTATEHFKGSYASLGALQSAVPAGNAGDYAFVDVAGVGAKQYIWDATDGAWVAEAVESGQQLFEAVAGEAISGGKAVIIDTDGKAYVYNINNENHYGKPCGIAANGVSSGGTVSVFMDGVVTEVGSGWQAGRLYYVSATGTLTTTPPTAGIVKIIGVGVGQDKILLNNGLELITI